MIILILVFKLVFGSKLSQDHSFTSDSTNNFRVGREDVINHEGYESTSLFWRKEAQKKLRQHLEKKLNENVAKNLIFFLGDGMSISTLTSSRIYSGQKMGFSGEESVLSFEEFPYVGLSKTYCFDKQTADSACSATAYFTGVKANYGTIGVNPKVRLNDCKASLDEKNQVSSIMSWAQKAGKATGIVTTTRVTHASPAGAYANTANRDWESDVDMEKFPDSHNCPDIATQLIKGKIGQSFNVIYGGGREKFISEKISDKDGQKGQRRDGLDLINEWSKTKNSSKSTYIHNRQGLVDMNHSNIEHVLGLFNNDHLSYHLDNNDLNEPSLKEMTVSAIEVMRKNPRGFVLFVEGGRIDHAHHENLARHALEETIQFSEAVRLATEITDENDTLIVVTSDHAHTMTLSGYSLRGKDVLGLNTEISDIDGMPYASISYANGPSAKTQRYKMTQEELKQKDYKYPSLVPLSSETHGGEDVAIFALGPWAHIFSGVVEQNVLPHFMAFAMCIGDGLTTCSSNQW